MLRVRVFKCPQSMRPFRDFTVDDNDPAQRRVLGIQKGFVRETAKLAKDDPKVFRQRILVTPILFAPKRETAKAGVR
jgi:hypothetical protein